MFSCSKPDVKLDWNNWINMNLVFKGAIALYNIYVCLYDLNAPVKNYFIDNIMKF